MPDLGKNLFNKSLNKLVLHTHINTIKEWHVWYAGLLPSSSCRAQGPLLRSHLWARRPSGLAPLLGLTDWEQRPSLSIQTILSPVFCSFRWCWHTRCRPHPLPSLFCYKSLHSLFPQRSEAEFQINLRRGVLGQTWTLRSSPAPVTAKSQLLVPWGRVLTRAITVLLPDTLLHFRGACLGLLSRLNWLSQFCCILFDASNLWLHVTFNSTHAGTPCILFVMTEYFLKCFLFLL